MDTGSLHSAQSPLKCQVQLLGGNDSFSLTIRFEDQIIGSYAPTFKKFSSTQCDIPLVPYRFHLKFICIICESKTIINTLSKVTYSSQLWKFRSSTYQPGGALQPPIVQHKSENTEISSRLRRGWDKGAMTPLRPPSWNVQNSHKKDGRLVRQFIFHISYPLPSSKFLATLPEIQWLSPI